MKPLTCRVLAFLLSISGLSLMVLVIRALYARDHAAQTLMFGMGIPLVLLEATVAGLLLRGAAKFMGIARHTRDRR